MPLLGNYREYSWLKRKPILPSSMYRATTLKTGMIQEWIIVIIANTMTKHLLTKMFVLLSFFGIAIALQGQLMDAGAAKKIPELEKVLHNIRQQGLTSNQGRVVLEQNLDEVTIR
jgi:hypothetical protein